MAWTVVADVTSRWVGADAPAAATIQAFITDAETLVASEYSTLDARIADEDDPVTTERVVMVVARMVIRALRNPDNVRSTQTGPFGTTFAGDNPGGLYLSDDDRKLLGDPGGTESGAYSIDMLGDALSIHSEACSLRFGATYCSCGADIAGYPLFGV